MYKRPKPRTKYCGVYAIRHIATGATYIGGSSDITGRFTHHRFTLRRGINKTKALQELWTSSGEAAFEFVTLEICDPENLLAREDAWISGTNNLLNTVPGAQTGYFSKPSEARKHAARLRWSSAEYREKQEAAVKARRAVAAALPDSSGIERDHHGA